LNQYCEISIVQFIFAANTKCSLCGLNFTTSAYLDAHFKRRHGGYEMNARPYKCTECARAFAYFATLRTHVRHVHDGHRGTHVCTTCATPFQSRAHLERHTRKHTGERPYACTLCPSRVAFSQTDQLRVHIRSLHTHERPFQCELCEVVFAESGQLRKHTARTVHLQAE
jgi:KRAB domain-containing zinc finger protein